MTSHRLWIVVTALAGCWRSDVPVQQATARPAAAVLPVCPLTVSQHVTANLWARELFPGCPPAPFDTIGVTCTAAGCPMPCRSRATHSSGNVNEFKYTYANGRLVELDGASTTGETFAAGTPATWRERCDYAGGRLTSCESFRGALRIERDANGRITEIHAASNTSNRDRVVTPTYDARGAAARLRFDGSDRTSTLHRDATHRLTGESITWPFEGTTRFTYDYDARGRWVHTSEGDASQDDASYEYNATGSLVKITRRTSLGGLTTTTITYDAQQRPRRITEEGRQTDLEAEQPTVSREDFEYDCR